MEAGSPSTSCSSAVWGGRLICGGGREVGFVHVLLRVTGDLDGAECVVKGLGGFEEASVWIGLSRTLIAGEDEVSGIVGGLSGAGAGGFELRNVRFVCTKISSQKGETESSMLALASSRSWVCVGRGTTVSRRNL